MSKNQRNAPCPCGSGIKFKRCCGSPNATNNSSGTRVSGASQLLVEKIKEQRIRDEIRWRYEGRGRPIISHLHRDRRWVVVGSRIYHSSRWVYFPDFLHDYMKETLGADWGNSELQKRSKNQNPIIQWYKHCAESVPQHVKDEDGHSFGNATGALNCYLGLAYGLYLLEHNVELQKRLINRLKIKQQFQGAYYEVIIASCLIRAGFSLVLEDETDDTRKHCEFFAKSPTTGKEYAVEAKMRSVRGVLGKPFKDGAPPTSKPTKQISTHLNSALAKTTARDRFVFIDVNAPPERPAEDVEPLHEKNPSWIKPGVELLEMREKDLCEGVKAYVFVTNFPYHYNLDEVFVPTAALAYGLGIDEFGKGDSIRLPEAWRRKQRHIDAHNVMETIKSYPSIPNTFDGDVPLTKQSTSDRIIVGQTYKFQGPTGHGSDIIGRVTSATVNEAAQKIVIAVATNDGRAVLLDRPIRADELAAWKDRPEGLFRDLKAKPNDFSSSYELFEWLVDCYRHTSRDRLLELAAKHPNYDAISKMSTMDACLEICEAWAASIPVDIKD